MSKCSDRSSNASTEWGEEAMRRNIRSRSLCSNRSSNDGGLESWEELPPDSELRKSKDQPPVRKSKDQPPVKLVSIATVMDPRSRSWTSYGEGFR
eukprot:342477-Prorocentrum_minimum.AAC.1